jgi:hypothetical protein
MIDYKTYEFDAEQQQMRLQFDRDEHSNWNLAYWIHKYFNKSFYVVEPFGLFDKRQMFSWKIAGEFFKTLEDRPIIIDFCTEVWPEDNMPMFLDLLHIQQYLPNAIILQGDARYRNQPNRIWYQHIWEYQRHSDNTFDRDIGLAAADCVDRKYTLSCLNRRPMAHRVWWLTEFVKQGWINDCNIFTFLERDPYSDFPVHEHENYLEFLIPERKQMFLSHISNLPFKFGNFRGENDITNNHPAFSDSYLNIVTESDVEAVWFSEKTMKPLSTGQLFVIAAGAGSVACLREFGFDMFDDIIDHARYDNILNWNDRMTAVSGLVAELYNTNWKDVYQRTHRRRVKNIERFWSPEFRNIICSELPKLSNL